MCYVYAVVPQPCFIGKKQKLWNNSVAFVYWRVVSTQNTAYTHAGCVVFCSLHVVKVKLHQQRTSIQQRTSMHARMPRMCAATSNHDDRRWSWYPRSRSMTACAVMQLHLRHMERAKKQRNQRVYKHCFVLIQRVNTQTQHYYFTVSVFFLMKHGCGTTAYT